MNDQLLAFKMFILRKEIDIYINSDVGDAEYEEMLEMKKYDLLKEYYGKFGDNIIPLRK